MERRARLAPGRDDVKLCRLPPARCRMDAALWQRGRDGGLPAVPAGNRNQVDGALPWFWRQRCSIDPGPEEPRAPPAWGSWGAGGIWDLRYPGPGAHSGRAHPCHIALVSRGRVGRASRAGGTWINGKCRPGWCVSGRIVRAGTVGPLKRLPARARLGPGCQMRGLARPAGDRMRDSGTLARLVRDT